MSSYLIASPTNVGLLAEQREAGHGHGHGVHVDGPEVHEEDNLQLDVRLPADGDAAANVGVLPVPEQKQIP